MMLMTEATAEMVREWQQVFIQYKERLQPNRKNSTELISYLRRKYPVQELADEN